MSDASERLGLRLVLGDGTGQPKEERREPEDSADADGASATDTSTRTNSLISVITSEEKMSERKSKYG